MNRRQWLRGALLPFAAALAGEAARPAAGADMFPQAIRCVSLRVLQDGLAGVCRDETCTPQALLHLGGLGQVHGFVIDRERHDLVLFGIARSGPEAEPLHTGDWVHALRSATHRYLNGDGSFSAPGVSIDPAPQVVRTLMGFDASALGAGEPLASKAASTWGVICAAPQNVRPIGLQREGLRSHYLLAIERADEEMKSYVDGTLPLPGLEVPSRILLERHEAAFRSGRPSPPGRGFSMSRYWFHAGTVRCGLGPDSCVLLQCDVRLSTEAQMIARRGLVDSHERDELADRCAESFTALLPGLAAANPVYGALVAIYRLQSLAVSLVKLQGMRHAQLDLGNLLDQWAPPLHDVPSQVPGRWRVAAGDYRAERAGGYTISRVRIPSCGGVNVDPAPTGTPHRGAQRIGRAAVAGRDAFGRRSPLYWEVAAET